jgi:tripartite-type tricarboxylate transporter receptor subunit TctC
MPRIGRPGAACACLALCLFWSLPAAAQDYATRPVRMVVPQAAGSSTDIVARILAEHMVPRLKQQVIVDPRPGAGGTIGAGIVAKAQADGHTLMMANSGPLAINVGLHSALPYHPERDFAPISLTARGPYVFMVHPSVPAATVGQLIALAKKAPRELTFGSGGNGTGTHLSGELLQQMAGVALLHVPYKGTGPGLTDLVAGHVSAMFAGVPPALPHVHARRVKALAVTSAVRSQSLPDVPTMAEAGISGYAVDLWLGLVAPAGTPPAIVRHLNALVTETFQSPAIRERIARLGLEATVSSPQEFSAFIKTEIAKWADVINRGGVKVQ